MPVSELTDPRAIRALAHPLRLALMEELAAAGPLTATEAGRVLGESPAGCSFHLRQLAKYGFVAEAGPGPGRNRPWRLADRVLALQPGTDSAPEVAVGLSQLSLVMYERALARLRRWWATKGSYPPRWRRAEAAMQTIWWVTPEELEALESEISPLLLRYRERHADPAKRPPGAAPVEFLAFAYPLRPATSEPSGARPEA